MQTRENDLFDACACQELLECDTAVETSINCRHPNSVITDARDGKAVPVSDESTFFF